MVMNYLDAFDLRVQFEGYDLTNTCQVQEFLDQTYSLGEISIDASMEEGVLDQTTRFPYHGDGNLRINRVLRTESEGGIVRLISDQIEISGDSSGSVSLAKERFLSELEEYLSLGNEEF